MVLDWIGRIRFIPLSLVASASALVLYRYCTSGVGALPPPTSDTLLAHRSAWQSIRRYRRRLTHPPAMPAIRSDRPRVDVILRVPKREAWSERAVRRREGASRSALTAAAASIDDDLAYAASPYIARNSSHQVHQTRVAL